MSTEENTPGGSAHVAPHVSPHARLGQDVQFGAHREWSKAMNDGLSAHRPTPRLAMAQPLREGYADAQRAVRAMQKNDSDRFAKLGNG